MDLSIKDSSCTQCGIGSFCKKRCQVNTLDNNAELVIIGSYPDLYNETNDTVMQGNTYDLMHQGMSKGFNPDTSKIHYTYLLKCNPRGKEPSKQELAICLQYLKEELEFIQPKAIVIIGGYAAKKLLGFDEDTTLRAMRDLKLHDLSFTTSEGVKVSIPTKVTYSPNYVVNNRVVLKYFIKDIYDAYAIATEVEATEADTKVTLITDIDAFCELLDTCLEVGVCSWDFETNGTLNRRYNREVFFATGLAISFQQGSGFFIPLEQFDSPIPEHLRRDWSIEVLRLFSVQIIENPNMKIIGQNLKFDFHVLANYVGAFNILADYDDTMYLDHSIDNTRPHGLKEMVTRFYPQYGGYEQEVNKYKWDSIPLPILSKYACVDSDMTLRLKTALEIELLHDTRSYKVYKNIIIPAAIATFQAEYRGLNVDNKYLVSAIANVQDMIAKVEKAIFNIPKVLKFDRYNRNAQNRKDLSNLESKLTKWMESHQPGTTNEQKYRDQINALRTGQTTKHKPFNLGSPKQVKAFLYNVEGLALKVVVDPSTKKAGGTGESTLKLLDDNTGFIPLLLEYRSLKKTLSTYLIGIQDRLDTNSILHADFKVTGTDTGRISCKDPNLMNMSNEYKQKYDTTKKAARYIKGMFVPPKDHHIIQVDYSQAELRCIAYYAQCAYMLNAYANGVDLHAQTAADVLHITLDEFYQLDKKEQKLQRYRAKAVNFGFIYGMSAESFRHYAFNDYGLSYSLQECIKIRTVYFDKRPELLVYHETYKQKAKLHGQIRTIFGSKRILPDIKSDNSFKQSNAERQAINTPIQGSSGLMTIFAINILQHRLDKRVKFVNTVHDSIIYYIPNDLLESELKVIKYACENLPIKHYFDRHFEEEGKISVKMGVDIEVSDKNWASLEEVEVLLN